MMRFTNFLIVVFAVVLAAAQARAQGDLDLLSTSVAPNVMIEFDNSGSMSHAVWHADMDKGLFHDLGPIATYCYVNGYGSVPALAGSDGLCVGSGDPNDRCPDNEANLSSGGQVWCHTSQVPGSCAMNPAGWTCDDTTYSAAAGYNPAWTVWTLPDINPVGGTTRWSRNYLWWVLGQLTTGVTPNISTQDRMTAAKAVVTNLIDSVNPDAQPETVRFGLARFRSDTHGGEIVVPITDANKATLMSSINGLVPSGWTPLSETLLDVGQYMSGDTGLGSCAATSTISAGNPMDEYCRKNFVVVLTDGVSTQDLHDAGYGTADFICAIGNADGDLNEDPDPTSGRVDAPPYTDNGTDWLDDVSYYFYHNDLRDDLDETQNIITYTVGFTVDHPLLEDTASNSTGKYFTTNTAESLSDDLTKAIHEIIDRSASFTAATVPSSRTAFADGFYVSYFEPRTEAAFWPGHFQAFRIGPDFTILDKDGQPALDSSGSFISPRNPFWDVQDRLLDASHPPRTVYTTKAGARTDFTTAMIDEIDLNIGATDMTAYPNDPNDPFADEGALADAMVNYLYGQDAFDQDMDGDKTDLRDAVLGDVFHSNPIVVGPPPPAMSKEEGYGPADVNGTFLNQFLDRERRIYFGANDGMLHAIEAGSAHTGDNPLTPETEDGYYDIGSGNEAWAYVPGVLLNQVKMVPRNRPRSHYFVDGSPSAADVWLPSSSIDTTKEPSEWATVLVTGMRQGGDGYIALDVTDPFPSPGDPHYPYPGLLWEMDGSTEPLGEAWSEPIITRVRVRGGTGSGDHCGPDDGEVDCREQWVAIFGGGYLVSGDANLAGYVSDPNSPVWDNASKAVFMVDIEDGSVIAKLAYDPSDAVLANMVYSLPSTAGVLDTDFDGFADLAYIGDLGGQLWKWDIEAIGTDSGDPDDLIDNWEAGIFFRAPTAVVAGDTRYKSIFYPPVAALLGGELVVSFGTGERSDLNYLGSATEDENNRFYVVKDPNPHGPASIPPVPYDENDVTELRADDDTDPDPTDLGFYVIAEDGEKFITNHIAFAGFLITVSYQPDMSPGDICTQGGQAFIYVFAIDDGAGFFDDPDASVGGRRLSIGSGAPTDPRISVSTGGDGGVQLFIQTSKGKVIGLEGPELDTDRVELVYWKQDL